MRDIGMQKPQKSSSGERFTVNFNFSPAAFRGKLVFIRIFFRVTHADGPAVGAEASRKFLNLSHTVKKNGSSSRFPGLCQRHFGRKRKHYDPKQTNNDNNIYIHRQ